MYNNYYMLICVRECIIIYLCASCALEKTHLHFIPTGWINLRDRWQCSALVEILLECGAKGRLSECF